MDFQKYKISILLLLLALILSSTSHPFTANTEGALTSEQSCDSESCDCISVRRDEISVICRTKGLSRFPEKIPVQTMLIDLSGNHFKTVSPETLLGLKFLHLMTLKLSKCSIGSIVLDTFRSSSFPCLKKLFVSSNNLTNVQELTQLNNLPHLRFVDISDNPQLDCTEARSVLPDVFVFCGRSDNEQVRITTSKQEKDKSTSSVPTPEVKTESESPSRSSDLAEDFSREATPEKMVPTKRHSIDSMEKSTASLLSSEPPIQRQSLMTSEPTVMLSNRPGLGLETTTQLTFEEPDYAFINFIRQYYPWVHVGFLNLLILFIVICIINFKKIFREVIIHKNRKRGIHQERFSRKPLLDDSYNKSPSQSSLDSENGLGHIYETIPNGDDLNYSRLQFQ